MAWTPPPPPSKIKRHRQSCTPESTKAEKLYCSEMINWGGPLITEQNWNLDGKLQILKAI